MTKNKQAKRAAHARKLRTGEPYVLPRRASAGKALRDQLLEEALTELDFDLATAEFADASDEIAAVIEEERETSADASDTGGWTEDDDSGYGPYSSFAHAMAKDD